jgi:adenine-specific DNA-methyltransferase
MRELLEAIASPVIVVSFNNEGFLSRDELEAMLAGLWGGTGQVAIIENDFKRYVGAQIGIHNLAGQKVGRVSHLRNKEFVYVVTRDRSDYRR